MNQPKLVDTKGAAEILRLTPRALERRRQTGDGPPYIRLSATCVRYDVSVLEGWLKERTATSTAEEASRSTPARAEP